MCLCDLGHIKYMNDIIWEKLGGIGGGVGGWVGAGLTCLQRRWMLWEVPTIWPRCFGNDTSVIVTLVNADGKTDSTNVLYLCDCYRQGHPNQGCSGRRSAEPDWRKFQKHKTVTTKRRTNQPNQKCFFFFERFFRCGPPVNMDGTITYRPSQSICAL